MGRGTQSIIDNSGDESRSREQDAELFLMIQKLQTQVTTLLGAMNTVSTDNSSTTSLDDTEVFTGAWEDVSAYESVIVAIATDQNGSFSVQFSPDGVNQDSTLSKHFKTNQIEPPHRYTVTRQYARVVFTNDSGSNQTYFRLQTILAGNSRDLNAPMDQVLAQDYDASPVRPSDFHTEVALGLRQGHETWNKFGYNLDVDSASGEEIIASWGGTFQYLTAGETIDIVSSSTNDDLVGTGCQKVIIWGVDENWDPQLEIVEMDGLVTVTTSTSWIGINRISIYKAGTGLGNAGTIDVTATSSGYTLAQMPVGDGTSQQCMFYVPAGHQFLAEWLHFDAIKTSGGSKPEITFKGYVYSDVATAEFEVFRDSLDIALSNTLTISPPVPFVISEKSILWFVADSDTNDTAVRSRFSGELVRSAGT